MKVILAGASGRVGAAILQELEGTASITHIICLCRRAGNGHHPKVRWVIVGDWEDYSDAELGLMQGAQAVVW